MNFHWLNSSLYHAAAMLWEMFWALVLGFAISAVLQVFVSKEQMARLFGKSGPKEVLLAMGLGAASSSCSYAAAATMKTVFKKGAAFLPSLAFLIASTNLVVELGVVLWILLGWRFVLAEVIGAFVMVAVVATIFAIRPPREIIEAARKHRESPTGGRHSTGAKKTWLVRVADAFVMDWSMLWKEIVIGVVTAGFLMVLVPKEWWQNLFISGGSHSVRLFENAFIGPLVAAASFVCSVGNIPLAGLLWTGGAGFGGVIAFIYGDLIVLPLVIAYRKYYGIKAALYITLILFLAMALAGVVVELSFSAMRLVPKAGPGISPMSQAGFSWNYTTWLDLAGLIVGGCLFFIHNQNRRPT